MLDLGLEITPPTRGEVLIYKYSSDDFRQLRGVDLRRANREFFTHGTGPRAVFQERADREGQLFARGGALEEVALAFEHILREHPAAPVVTPERVLAG